VLAGKQVEPLPGHQVAEERGVGTQPGARVAGGGGDLQGFERAGRDGGRDRVGEQVGTGPLPEQVDDLLVGGDVTAGGTAERLAEGAGENVDPVHHPEPLRRAAAAVADEPDGVAVVDHHHGAELLGGSQIRSRGAR
jgi:hypothetical protein